MACPFLREKRKNNVTTVLQPCQVFYNSTQSPTSPQAMEVSINTLSMKVFVLFHTFRVVLLKTKVKHFKPAALFVSINLSQVLLENLLSYYCHCFTFDISLRKLAEKKIDLSTSCVTLCPGVSCHHQHSDYHPVCTEPHSGDSRGAGQACSCGSLGETRLEGAQTLVLGRGRGWRHKVTDPTDSPGRVLKGA